MNGILTPETKVEGICFNGVGIDLDISTGKETFFEYDNFPENIEIENYVKNGIWHLNFKQKSDSFLTKIFGFSFNSGFSGNANLKVDKNIFSFDINNVSGDISLNKLELEKFKVKTVSGDINIYNSKIKYLEFFSTSGDLSSSNSIFYSVDIKNVSGDCNIDYLDSKFKNVFIKTVSGDTEIYISGNDIVFIKKGASPSGKIHSNIPLKFDINSHNIPSRFIDFKGVSGDLIIKLKGQISKQDIFSNKNTKENENKLSTNELLTAEERKILELYKAEKINKDFALELLKNIGYTEKDAEVFFNENIGGI
ncbi:MULTISPECIES: DUF4097 family beta strand repeat-containing protein [unclassified Marinitoga]|uniref:DUF4097 family beta strand repeat-containing protein n=1 Tax=unclassified Marinitoga TaxID=2640159 RepID=UPI0006416B79|nr:MULTISPECIES: DUF4097 family beta strand repeat-containing protein [unclassified Marinitoga]KLO24700.1 hypothetical protein X274_03165 [Marinitoga sp. 1155]NUU98809.1 hypothetical protein [Marinitoga sp. 1154]